MAAAASPAELVPPGVKFEPNDEALVAQYLLPRLSGLPLPCDGIIVEADPLSSPPWKLLEMYGRKKDAFLFAAGQARSSNDTHQKRTCAGGEWCWKGQKRNNSGTAGCEKLVVPGTGEVIAWRKYELNFHADGEQGSTGWVMDEYAVTAPSDLASSSIMAYHIRFISHGKNSKKHKMEEPEPQDWVAAGTTLPPHEGYTSATPCPVCPFVALVGRKATPSVVMDYAADQYEDVEIDELLRFISETPESNCA